MPTSTQYAYPVANTLRPNEGPKAYQIVFDLTTATRDELSITYPQLGMSQVQSVLIDNSRSDQAVSVEFSCNYQVITVPARTQAFMPVLLPRGAGFSIVAAGNVAAIVVLHLLNVEVSPTSFSSVPPTVLVGGSVSIAGLVQVAVSNTPDVNIAGQAGPVEVTPDATWPVDVVSSVGLAVTVSSLPLRSASLNLTGDTVIKASAGILYQANVATVGAGLSSLHDCATTGAAGASNLIAALDNTVLNSRTFESWPFSTGLVLITGGGGAATAVCYG